MSRTYRNRVKSFSRYWGSFDLESEFNDKAVEQAMARYYSSSDKFHSWKLPKEYRNSINRQRRRIDKEALFAELNGGGGCFCAWNCKSSNAQGYF